MMRSMAALGMAALFSLPAAADAQVRIMPSTMAGAPDFHLPMSATQVAEARASTIIAGILAEDYDLAGDDAQDLDRILQLTAFTEEVALSDETIAVVTDDAGPEAGARTPARNADMAAFLASPEGVDMMSAMSSGQIEAMTLLVMAMADPQAAREVLVSRDMSGSETAADPQIRTSMLLQGWNVRKDEFGAVQMYQESAPGSDIEIEVGLVIGALGAVTDIRTIGQEVIVAFESGDTLSGSVMQSGSSLVGRLGGIPPLSDPDQATVPDAPPPSLEILLSAPVVRTPEIATRASNVVQVAGAEIITEEIITEETPDEHDAALDPGTSSLAPVTSIRPEPHPRNRQD